MAYGKPVTDKRAIRTKKAIRNAFAELMKEKDINEITVKNVADRACVNRKTFYNYYSGIYKLIEEIEYDLVSSFDNALADLDLIKCLSDPDILFDRLNSLIKTDPDFYGNMFTMDENLNLVTKITSIIKAKTKRSICSQLGLEDKKADIALEFAITGMVAVYRMWFRSDRSIPLSDATSVVGAMCFDGIKGLLTDV
ncbi:MAG: TetR/AcrR family transcriptional regulator [Clostridia bacterium]|nr:TetR/AcrR family transcriptional regulator [Clostridia bacterium]